MPAHVDGRRGGIFGLHAALRRSAVSTACPADARLHVCPADFAARVATSPHACPAVMGRECVSAWGLRLIFSSTASTSCRCALGNVRQQQPQPQIQHSYGTADRCTVPYSTVHVCTQFARVLSRDSLRSYTSFVLRRPRCCRDYFTVLYNVSYRYT